MTPETLYYLDQIQSEDRGQVGDKAFFLSQLQQRGYPVVPGLIVSAPVFRQFLETVTWSEPLFGDLPGSSLHLSVDNPAQLQIVAQQIRSEINQTPLWQDWLEQILSRVQIWDASMLMVRPSIVLKTSTNPMLCDRISGLLQSQICLVETADIARAIRQVWAELYRARSLMYWQRSGVPLQRINLALLIQPVEGTIASGDLRISPESLTIRSVWGLGKALSEGMIAPDIFELNPYTGEVLASSIGDKSHLYQVPSASLATPQLAVSWVEELKQQQPSITPTQGHQLASLSRQISAEFKTPVKVEWLFNAAENVSITQVHPISASLLHPRLSSGASRGAQTTHPTLSLPPVHHQNVAETHLDTQTFTLTGLAAAKGKVLATALVLAATEPWPAQIPPKTVLVTSVITPDLILHLKQATGLVTDEGTLTSHGAIVARELGIPAVVGTRVATHQLHTGDLLLIDGDRGTIQRLQPTDSGSTEPHKSNVMPLAPTALAHTHNTFAVQPLRPIASGHSPLTKTPLWVNLSQAETAAQVATLPVDGVGLLRAELMIRNLLDDRPLSDWVPRAAELSTRIAQYLTPIAAAFAPRPIYYRALDLRSHEFANGTLREPNPILGIHGALGYIRAPALFDIELAALRQLQQAGFENIHLMLPFVRTVDEVVFCRDRALQAGLLQAPMQLWIMAEVPSILFLVPELVAAGVQGISIGSNDLTQLLLAIDRDNPETAALLDPQNPAVLRAMHHLIVAARQAGIPCSVCGQTPDDHPEIIEQLVQWGISSISVSPDALERTRQSIAQAEQRLGHHTAL